MGLRETTLGQGMLWKAGRPEGGEGGGGERGVVVVRKGRIPCRSREGDFSFTRGEGEEEGEG